MQRNTKSRGIDTLFPIPDSPARRVSGGSNSQVQARYESNNNGLLSRVYSAPAVANTDAETGDPIGGKADMVENLYQPPAPPAPTATNSFDALKKWWYGQ